MASTFMSVRFYEVTVVDWAGEDGESMEYDRAKGDSIF